MSNQTTSVAMNSLASKKKMDICFKYLVLGSVVLLCVTLISFPLAGRGPLSRLLFQLGLAGENNVGAWWSGMLLLLAAVLAFDGVWRKDLSENGPRGWLMLSLILLMLSLDEVGSVHEWLGKIGGEAAWIPLGIVGAAMLTYALTKLWQAGLKRSHVAIIAMSFFLFGSVVAQEHIQHLWTWDNPFIYGVRAFIEEGTEILAMLLLLYVTKFNTHYLLEHDSTKAFGMARLYPKAAIILGIILLPILVAASFVLPYPGGPADWLASAIFMLGACIIFNEIMSGRTDVARPKLLLATLIFASVQANAIGIRYDPEIFGVVVSLRGLTVALLIPLIWLFLSRLEYMRMRINFPTVALVSACLVVLAGYSSAQLIWVTVPPIIAIWTYSSIVMVDKQE